MPLLAFVLEQMLQPEEVTRPDFPQLRKALPKWAEVIEFVRRNPAAMRPEGEIFRINRTLEEIEQSYVRAGGSARPSIAGLSAAELCAGRDPLQRARSEGSLPTDSQLGQSQRATAASPPPSFDARQAPSSPQPVFYAAAPTAPAPQQVFYATAPAAPPPQQPSSVFYGYAAPAQVEFEQLPDFRTTAYPAAAPARATHEDRDNFFGSAPQTPRLAEPSAFDHFERGSSGVDFTSMAAAHGRRPSSRQPRGSLSPDFYEKNNIPRAYHSETGAVYRSVTEERLELNDYGEQVKRIYVKYELIEQEPATEAQSMGEVSALPTIVQSFSYTPPAASELSKPSYALGSAQTQLSEEDAQHRQTLSQFMGSFKPHDWQRAVAEGQLPPR